MLGKNKVKEKIENGGKVYGCGMHLASVPTVEILGLSGFDFLFIDTEHGPYDFETTSQFIIASQLRGMTPFVRVKNLERSSVLKMLDIGAMGIIVPCIRSVDDVKELVQYGKYPPLGDRGFGLARKTGYGIDPDMGTVTDYYGWANRETLLLPQCETIEALNCIEDIVAVEGIDGILVGPYDLSISMGLSADFDGSNPVFLKALDRIVKACKAAGKFCFTVAYTPEDAKAQYERGFDGVVTGDTAFLSAGARQYVDALKGFTRRTESTGWFAKQGTDILPD